MLSYLRKTNENLIKKCSLEGDTIGIEKQKLIQTLLSKEDCFFEMPMPVAFSVLIDLGFSQDKALELYTQLTSAEEYKRVKLNKK